MHGNCRGLTPEFDVVRHILSQQDAAARLVEELSGLTGVTLTLPAQLDDGLLGHLAFELDVALTLANRAFVEALAPRCDNPLVALCNDLAEMLFVERHARTEYVTNETGAPPFVIRKLLLEYAVHARALDRVIGALTKDFCATRCDRLPVGCCSIQGYDMGLVPQTMLEAQRLEAHRGGLLPIERADECRYHTPRGCGITLFKSPACLGCLCADLQLHLKKTTPPHLAEDFIAQLAELNNVYIDRGVIFTKMQHAILAGERLFCAVDC